MGASVAVHADLRISVCGPTEVELGAVPVGIETDHVGPEPGSEMNPEQPGHPNLE
jgi:hypothetical protein